MNIHIDPTWITTICAVIGLITTFFGLNFVIKQIRSAAVDRLFARMHDFHRLFIENPKLREFFYSKRYYKKEEDDEVILIVAEALADFFQQIYYELPNMPKSSRNGWRNYIRSISKSSPVIQSHIIDNSEWYHPKFVDWLVGAAK
jgi:hypothetical protein